METKSLLANKAISGYHSQSDGARQEAHLSPSPRRLGKCARFWVSHEMAIGPNHHLSYTLRLGGQGPQRRGSASDMMAPYARADLELGNGVAWGIEINRRPVHTLSTGAMGEVAHSNPH